MRDLRAELKDWTDGTPIEWQPSDGDILVGFLRERLTDASGAECIVVEEERTGIPVALSLDSPMLRSLLEIHNPRGSERIGIKCIGLDADGTRRFVMVLDRWATNEGEAETDEDETGGASAEERDYIEQMMQGGGLPNENSPATKSPPVSGLWSSISANSSQYARLSALLALLILGGLLTACPKWFLSLF